MANNGLTYIEDRRQEPDSDRQGAFKRGWKEATKSQGDSDVWKRYSDDPELKTLTWDNLGYRLGSLFGDSTDELKQEMFEWCVEQRKYGW